MASSGALVRHDDLSSSESSGSRFRLPVSYCVVQEVLFSYKLQPEVYTMIRPDRFSSAGVEFFEQFGPEHSGPVRI